MKDCCAHETEHQRRFLGLSPASPSATASVRPIEMSNVLPCGDRFELLTTRSSARLANWPPRCMCLACRDKPLCGLR
eukprot:3786232-Pleurochrysis_carterae.AAC.2